MPTITAAAVLHLAAACGGPAVPEWRMFAHPTVESGFNTLAIGDNATHRSYAPATEAEAIRIARELLALHHRIDVGVMQVTDSNFAALGLTIETAFNAQKNVCAGKAVIAEAYAADVRVSCRYNTGRPNCNNGYPQKIEAAMRRFEPEAPAPVAVTVTKPPAGRPPAWDVYASAMVRRGSGE